MTQHAEPHHDPRFDDPRAEADDKWTPPELPGQDAPPDRQPDPERADWMPPEHRPPSILGGTPDDRPVREDPTATMLPTNDPPAMPSPATDPAKRGVGMPDNSLRHDHDLTPPPGMSTGSAPSAPPMPPAPGRALDTAPARALDTAPGGTMAAAPGRAMGATTGTTPMGAGPGTGALDPLWPDAEAARFEGRWREVQLGFVDDPRRAADEARSLLDEVVDRLTRAISDRRQELDTWRADGNSNGADDTEAMLSAVRRYRRLMDQLLAVGQPH